MTHLSVASVPPGAVVSSIGLTNLGPSAESSSANRSSDEPPEINKSGLYGTSCLLRELSINMLTAENKSRRSVRQQLLVLAFYPRASSTSQSPLNMSYLPLEIWAELNGPSCSCGLSRPSFWSWSPPPLCLRHTLSPWAHPPPGSWVCSLLKLEMSGPPPPSSFSRGG